MKDFLELCISAIILLAQLIWLLFKLAVGYVILVGCFTSLGIESPFLSYAGQYAEALINKGYSYPLAKMGGLVASSKAGNEIFIMKNSWFEKWLGLLFLVLFVWFIQLRKKINLLESHIEQMKLCNVTLLNYLRIEPLTDGQVKIREEGVIKQK